MTSARLSTDSDARRDAQAHAWAIEAAESAKPHVTPLGRFSLGEPVSGVTSEMLVAGINAHFEHHNRFEKVIADAQRRISGWNGYPLVRTFLDPEPQPGEIGN